MAHALNETVFINVACNGLHALRGSLLVFDTIRAGFPHADIRVVDNASHPATVETIESAVARVGGTLTRLANRVQHGDFINRTLMAHEGRLVFVDTDMIFHEDCSGWALEEGVLLAGRYIPRLESDEAIHAPRIHPSFLIVPDAETLRDTLGEIESGTWYFKGFEGYASELDGKRIVFDVGAAVTAALGEDCIDAFPPSMLDRYEHLFMGTVPEEVYRVGLPTRIADGIRQSHAADPTALKGLWRKQSANMEWNYLAGQLKYQGVEYGIFAARFHDLVNDEWFAHGGITDYTNGTFVGGVAEIHSPTEIRGTWGSIDLHPVESGGSVALPDRAYGWGRTNVYSCADLPTLCHLKLDGKDVVGLGDFWYEHEVGTIVPGSGWTWCGLRLDDGRAYIVREENEALECLALGDGGYRKIGGLWHEDGFTLEGERYTLLTPVPGLIKDPVRSLNYAETYSAILNSAGQRVGFAFLEHVPKGNGTNRFGPTPREMFLRWANKDQNAAECVHTLWRCSQIADDLADGETPQEFASPALLELLHTATSGLMQNPFWVANRTYLEPVLTSALLFWNASNDWAVSNRRDTQMFGYAYREAFSQVIVAVAHLTGGLEFAKNVLRELHAYYHHTGRVESFDSWRKEQTHGRRT